MPAAYFAEELIEYYPDAKVILTMRDPDEWARYGCHCMTPCSRDLFELTTHNYAKISQSLAP